MEAGRRVKEEGRENNLLDLIAADPAFPQTREELEQSMDPSKYAIPLLLMASARTFWISRATLSWRVLACFSIVRMV